jgi:hypothetical protein
MKKELDLSMQFDTIFMNLDSAVYSCGLVLSNSDSEKLQKSNIKRWIAIIDDKLEIFCGLMSYGNGQLYILINKERVKTLELRQGQIVKIKLSEDKSTYGMPLPAELEELFEQDPIGKWNFDQLLPGRQRNIIYWVSNVKNPQIRIKRAVFSLLYLTEKKGKLDFKEFYEEFKSFEF